MPRFETVKVPCAGRRVERPTPGGIGEPPRVRGDLGERLPVRVEHDGHEQRVVRGNGDADIDARVALDLAVDVRGVEAREVAQRSGRRLHDEVVERRHVVALVACLAPPRRDLRHVDVRRDGEEGNRGRRLDHPARDRRLRRRQLDDVTSPFPSAAAVARPRVAPAAALVTSSLVIRPPGPVPAMSWSETPSSTAVRLATGVAFGRRGPAPSLDGRARRDGARRDSRRGPPRGRRSLLAARSALAVREGRDRLAHRGRAALRHEDRGERARGLGLVHDGRLVRLDLDQPLAALEGVAGRLQPADDDGVGHRVRQLRHRQLAGHDGRLTP